MAKRVAKIGVSNAKRRKRDSVSEDRISGLPHDVLTSILSILNMKEASRTSVLSKIWRDKWTYITNLNFDSSQVNIDLELRKRPLKKERRRYLNWVNTVVRLHNGPTIDEFRIEFELGGNSKYSIDSWINFAIKKKVRSLVLIFSGHMRWRPVGKPYSFPPIFNTQKFLRSWSFGLSICNSLTNLQLIYSHIDGETLEYFLSNCLFLERLCVEGSDSLVNLKVAGPSLCLTYLEITYCFNLKNLEIYAKNLVSFKYFGPNISLSFPGTPSLMELSIGGNDKGIIDHFHPHLCCKFWSLKRLKLEITHLEAIQHLEFPVLNSLRDLVLYVWATDYDSLLSFTSLIEASPFLHKFVLELVWFDEPLFLRREIEHKPAKSLHHSLKEVEIVGFVGHFVDVEFAMYFVENAVMLEKIVLDPRNPLIFGSAREYEETEKKKAARKRAKNFAAKLHQEIEIIIV